MRPKLFLSDIGREQCGRCRRAYARAKVQPAYTLAPLHPAHDGEMVTMARSTKKKKTQTSTAARRTAKSVKAVAGRDPAMSRRPATRAKVRQSRLARNKGT
jgi:hypothetical protein